MAFRKRPAANLSREAIVAKRPACAEESPLNDHDETERVRRKLEEARQAVKALEAEYAEKLCQPWGPKAQGGFQPAPGKPIKIFVDGVFDLMHYGHMNAFRQARSLGDYLVVGVNSGETVAQCKGSWPVLSDEERQQMVAACRFVDEIVPASPYVMSEEYIQYLIDKWDIDYFVHGDDPCLVNGKDVYESVKRAGRFRSIPRTEGVSTTEIAGRVLLLTKEHHKELVKHADSNANEHHESSKLISRQSKFLVTSQLMQAFSASLPKSWDRGGSGRTVYVDGAWDMFHVGHIALLRRARELGDRLLVGVHSDAVVNQQRGFNYPLLAMHERVLSVLGCKYVDDILLDAPWHITEEMIATLGITIVARGSIHDCSDICSRDPQDPHAVPLKQGICKALPSESSFTIKDIIHRLQSHRSEAEIRLAEKQKKERAWYCEKHGIEPTLSDSAHPL